MQADLAQPRADFALRYVIFGGEALEPQSLRPWFERYGDVQPLLVNMYGITETTVHVTYRPIRGEDLESGQGSVIGQPIDVLFQESLADIATRCRSERIPEGSGDFGAARPVVLPAAAEGFLPE